MNKHQELVANLVISLGRQVHMITPLFQEDPVEMLMLASSVSMVGTVGIIQSVSQYDDIGTFKPTWDHVLFSCLLQANACDPTGGGRDGARMKVGVELSTIMKAMEQFQTLTGRSFEPLMNRSLVEVINEAKEKASFGISGELSKFLPN